MSGEHNQEFLDTNILVYAFSHDPKVAIARAVIRRRCMTSVQALNEFVSVARRKMKMDWPDVNTSLEAIKLATSSILPIELALHGRAVDLCRKYNFSIYDSLMITSALTAGATLIYSEDMQHGLLVEKQLRIHNPFLPVS